MTAFTRAALLVLAAATAAKTWSGRQAQPAECAVPVATRGAGRTAGVPAGPATRGLVDSLVARAVALQPDSSVRREGLTDRRCQALRLIEAAEGVALRLGDLELAQSVWERWADVQVAFAPERQALVNHVLAIGRCVTDPPRTAAPPARCEAEERAQERTQAALAERLVTVMAAQRRAFLTRAAAHFRATGQGARESDVLLRLASHVESGSGPLGTRQGAEYRRRAAEALARTGQPEQEGAALLLRAQALLGTSAPGDSVASLYRRAAERFTAAGAHDRAASAWASAGSYSHGSDPDATAADYARARDAYLRAGDTRAAAGVDAQLRGMTALARTQAAFAPGAPAGLLDSVTAECEASNADAATSCALLRQSKAARQMARGEFDAARTTLRETSAGQTPVAGTMAGFSAASVDAMIGHPDAAADIMRMVLALPGAVAGAGNPFGLTPVESRAVRAARTPLAVAAALAPAEARARAARKASVARLVALMRAPALASGGRTDEAERVIRRVLSDTPGSTLYDGSLRLTLSGLLERRGDLAAALVQARAAVRDFTPRTGSGKSPNDPSEMDAGGGLLRAALSAQARLAARDPAGAAEARAALGRADALRAASVLEGPNVWSRIKGHVETAEVLRSIARSSREARARGALLDTAHAHFDSAAAIAATVRTRFRAERDAVAWADQWAALHDGWTALWAERTLSGAPGDTAALAALGIAELGRAQALRDLLARGDSVPAPGAAWRGLPAHDSSEAGARRAPATFAAGLLGAARGPKTALLYLHHTSGGETYGWLAAPGQRVRLLSPTRRPPGWAERHVAALERGMRLAFARADTLTGARADSANAWKDAAAAALDSLGALLPHDALAALPDSTELVVVPHGVLGQVPFAALRVRAGAARPYLLTRFAVRQAPSLAALAAAEAAPVRLSPGAAGASGALVAAWPGLNAPLLRATAERDTVARLLGARALPTDSASERHVRVALFTAPAVHVAAHARASADARWVRDSTGVWLRPDTGRRGAAADARAGDGFLSMGELLDAAAGRRLTAELVVLSGCETGAGQASRSEGTIGLQRALLAAGARSVLTSLWVVDDAATATLMADFWRRWLRDADRPTKAEALRRAQLAMSRTAPAYYWAAFQMAGAR